MHFVAKMNGSVTNFQNLQLGNQPSKSINNCSKHIPSLETIDEGGTSNSDDICKIIDSHDANENINYLQQQIIAKQNNMSQPLMDAIKLRRKSYSKDTKGSCLEKKAKLEQFTPAQQHLQIEHPQHQQQNQPLSYRHPYLPSSLLESIKNRRVDQVDRSTTGSIGVAPSVATEGVAARHLRLSLEDAIVSRLQKKSTLSNVVCNSDSSKLNRGIPSPLKKQIQKMRKSIGESHSANCKQSGAAQNNRLKLFSPLKNDIERRRKSIVPQTLIPEEQCQRSNNGATEPLPLHPHRPLPTPLLKAINIRRFSIEEFSDSIGKTVQPNPNDGITAIRLDDITAHHTKLFSTIKTQIESRRKSFTANPPSVQASSMRKLNSLELETDHRVAVTLPTPVKRAINARRISLVEEKNSLDGSDSKPQEQAPSTLHIDNNKIDKCNKSDSFPGYRLLSPIKREIQKLRKSTLPEFISDVDVETVPSSTTIDLNKSGHCSRISLSLPTPVKIAINSRRLSLREATLTECFEGDHQQVVEKSQDVDKLQDMMEVDCMASDSLYQIENGDGNSALLSKSLFSPLKRQIEQRRKTISNANWCLAEIAATDESIQGVNSLPTAIIAAIHARRISFLNPASDIECDGGAEDMMDINNSNSLEQIMDAMLEALDNGEAEKESKQDTDADYLVCSIENSPDSDSELVLAVSDPKTSQIAEIVAQIMESDENDNGATCEAQENDWNLALMFRLPLEYVDATYSDYDEYFVEIYAKELESIANIDALIAYDISLDSYWSDPIMFRHRIGNLLLPSLEYTSAGTVVLRLECNDKEENELGVLVDNNESTLERCKQANEVQLEAIPMNSYTHIIETTTDVVTSNEEDMEREVADDENEFNRMEIDIIEEEDDQEDKEATGFQMDVSDLNGTHWGKSSSPNADQQLVPTESILDNKLTDNTLINNLENPMEKPMVLDENSGDIQIDSFTGSVCDQVIVENHADSKNIPTEVDIGSIASANTMSNEVKKKDLSAPDSNEPAVIEATNKRSHKPQADHELFTSVQSKKQRRGCTNDKKLLAADEEPQSEEGLQMLKDSKKKQTKSSSKSQTKRGKKEEEVVEQCLEEEIEMVEEALAILCDR